MIDFTQFPGTVAGVYFRLLNCAELQLVVMSASIFWRLRQSMQHQYISLGSACNAATMMKVAGLRRASYPFDWLLNVDDGLSAVTQIVVEDFSTVSESGSYEIVYHPPVGRSVPAYKLYPRTFHVHSDPASDPRTHTEMVRRFDRLREALRTEDFLHFVYYRELSQSRARTPGITAKAVFELMEKEATQFLSVIDKTRRGRTKILLVLESSVNDRREADDAARSAFSSDNRVAFGSALSRYDGDNQLLEQWQRDWINLIIKQTDMPLRLVIQCQLKRATRSIKRSIKSALSRG
ncbi:hypothetical protein CPJ18_01975 [Agrobacterium rosae]|uniref:Papain-like cysteine peptidase (DUF1796) n=1 Tax=Agrobacterium rosae TaxID=1972867 RepID=A0AAE5S1W1_9HYPH|nr:DUF1796 family putative cysteine peptidase [Agrobacterium rosae]POO54296.1 hypothetical protein CPJ18_01975 [Agrobacterium rosae]